MKRNHLILGSIILGGMAVISLAAYLLLFAPVNPRSEQYLFTINSGASISTVISEMVNDRYLRSQLGGKIAFALSNTQVVQPGVFNISPRMNAWQIASIIKAGETAGTRVTIPEGYTISQIATRLESSQITSVREFNQALSEIDKNKYSFLSTNNRQVINPFEGYLFPDTYEFYKKGNASYSGSRKVLKLYHQNFKSIQKLKRLVFLSNK
ncbi:MAG: endolytic transglycosylase MltG [Patescibacteria group bacterium]